MLNIPIRVRMLTAGEYMENTSPRPWLLMPYHLPTCCCVNIGHGDRLRSSLRAEELLFSISHAGPRYHGTRCYLDVGIEFDLTC